jgi:hypothetical protein
MDSLDITAELLYVYIQSREITAMTVVITGKAKDWLPCASLAGCAPGLWLTLLAASSASSTDNLTT